MHQTARQIDLIWCTAREYASTPLAMQIGGSALAFADRRRPRNVTWFRTVSRDLCRARPQIALMLLLLSSGWPGFGEAWP
jgi:hypothetical protein